MKHIPFAIIGVLSLGLVACGDKEESVSAPENAGRLSKLAEERNRPKPAAIPTESADVAPATGETAVLVDPAPAETASGTAEPIAPGNGGVAATGQSMTDEERAAARAQAREERMARMREQMVARWAERDTDGDGKLSQAELPERMRGRFADFDTNGDGFIDATEQQAMVQRMTERMREGGGRGDFRNRDRGDRGRWDRRGGGFERRRRN